MYTIKITTKQPMTKQQKYILLQAAAETDAGMQCRMEETSCTVSGGNIDPEQLAGLFGIVMGSCKPYEIISLLFLYEKMAKAQLPVE